MNVSENLITEDIKDRTKLMESQVEAFVNECKIKFKKIDEKLLRKAFLWCFESHQNKILSSGKPFCSYPLEVAKILLNEIPLDFTSIICALLHEIPNSGEKYTLKDIRSEFGNTIAEIVNGINKIQVAENLSIDQFENYRKLLLSLFKDVRIMLIKLAARLYLMRNLEYYETEEQKRISSETLEIYSPFAHRFGLGKIKWELEDLAFKFLHPDKYYEIEKMLQLKYQERVKFLEKFIEPIEENLKKSELLQKNNVKFEIHKRVKHIYSIYNKTLIRQKPVEELNDIYAIRIILDTDDEDLCFYVYGIISKLYEQVPETFKNYISYPKKNGYKSLHIAFKGDETKNVEVQIRTKKMHIIAEKGVAAHFVYKRGLIPAQSILEDEDLANWMDEVKELFEQEYADSREVLLESIKKNLALEEIYVFTPTNEFKILPKDSTPVDFAYYIHTEVGNHCIGAKVNGKIVPLNHKLSSGDIVEILTSETQVPEKEWLSFVASYRARAGINKFLKEESKRITEIGKKMFNDFLSLSKISFTKEELNKFAEYLGLKNIDSIYENYALNKIDNKTILNYYSGMDNIYRKIKKKFSWKSDSYDLSQDVIETDKKNIKIPNLPIIIAKCCNPIRGDSIIGIVVEGTNITVHRSFCQQAREELTDHSKNLINIEWDNINEQFFYTELVIHGNDNPDYIQNITNIILQSKNTKLIGFKFDNTDENFKSILKIKVTHLDDLQELTEKILHLEGIKKAERI
ncbi:MAG: RelA/SpoT family protein [Candidatus Kapabacteria bacterium]|nr:RelA/SpoT family protein [Candidatus Kapabacteria bacterium]